MSFIRVTQPKTTVVSSQVYALLADTVSNVKKNGRNNDAATQISDENRFYRVPHG